MSQERFIQISKEQKGNQIVTKTARMRTITTRKLQRQQLKDHQGNNKIRLDWHLHQSHGKDEELNKLYELANGSIGKKRQKFLDRISGRIATLKQVR